MKLMLNASEPNYGVVEDDMIMDSEPVIGDWTVNAKAHSLVSTIRDQKYFHNVGISIDFNVFSSLQENLLHVCSSWPTDYYAFGVI